MATAREVFETNTFGAMAMTQAVIPGFRHRRAGTVVNVTSSTTLAPFPLVAVYTASKTAVEGIASVAGPGIAGVQRARQAGRTRRWPEHAYCSEWRSSHGRLAA
jgi:NAD(P)-dependent dehydrogenase (short-subunit alcohol dehydrogenase family)